MKFSFLSVGIVILFPLSIFSQNVPIKVAIIGGGMAGVSAAHHIHEVDPSASITIFEKEKILGGNAKTVTVTNANNEQVKVDAGPQYFTEGPWDEYIKFLKIYNVYKPEQTSEFVGSIVIQKQGVGRPRLVTPLNGSFRGEKLGQLLKFKKFFDTAFQLFKSNDAGYTISIGDWVKELKIDDPFKEEIVLPFLASSLGTDIEDIKKTSAKDIVKLFAFRKPSNKSTFKVMHEGMGTHIQDIGVALEKKGVKIKRETPIKYVNYNGDKYLLYYGKERNVESKETDNYEMFDFVVFAVHADQAYRLLQENGQLDKIKTTLKQFEYFIARIVLHSDSTFINTEKPSFLNIMTTADNQIISNTMSLGMIDNRYKGIYKSWVSPELSTQIKLSGKFFHEEVFYHPLISPGFNIALADLNKQTNEIKSLCFAGGWSQGLETQETAVVSGKKAAEKYKFFKEHH